MTSIQRGTRGVWIVIGVCLSLLGLSARSRAAELDTAGNSAVEMHGFLSQGYLISGTNNYFTNTRDGTFQFNEFGLNVSADLTDRLRAGLQLLSRDLGNVGNNDINLAWGYGQYRWADWLILQAGLIKIPYGLYNETRDADLLRTPVFLPHSIYNENTREAYSAFFGLGLRGNLFLPTWGSFEYKLGYGEEELKDEKGLLLPAWIETVNMQVDHILGGLIVWDTPLTGFRLGVSLGQYDWSWTGQTIPHPYLEAIGREPGEPVQVSERNKIYRIFSAEYRRDNLTLAAEYLRDDDNDGDEEGYYGSVAYRFTDWWEAGVAYAVFYPHANDKDGASLAADGIPRYTAWQKELVVSTRFDLTEAWLLKVEGHVINGVANFYDEDNPDGLKEDSLLLAVKTTFSF